MMRERSRTLKGLFPDPKPPGRKNFIVENVKNLRRMEQFFHTNSKSAKDLKLPVSKQTNVINKQTNISDNQAVDDNEDLQEFKDLTIEHGMTKLLKSKSFHEDQINKRKCTSTVTTKKINSKKLSKPSMNGNVIRKTHCSRDQIEHKIKNQQKLKVHSSGDVRHEKLSESINKEKTNVKCRSQGIQTLDAQEIESLYAEGVIRYPSGKINKETIKSKPPDRGDTDEISNYSDANAKNNSEPYLNEGINHEKVNKEERTSLASKLASQLNNGAPPSSYRVGVVPKYIKDRKEALRKEQQDKVARKNSECPKGHVPIPDNERKETLSMLKKNYQEFVSELNMLPIRTDTLRSQKRKMEIEQQLTKLEEAIKVFSRPKVFVKVDS